MTKFSCTNFAVGAALVLLAWIGCFSSGTPTLICPMPLITIVPAFYLASRSFHSPYWLGVLLPTTLFFAWTPRISRGQSEVPRRSRVLLASLTVLSLAYFVVSWRDGVQYQGREHTIAVGVVNTIWAVILWTILYRSSRRSSFAINMLFHATLFAWVAWYAFPYLGELP